MLSVPLKMTSSILEPRRDLTDCSPKTQRIASKIFDFPHPLGPTTAVIPGSKYKVVLSAKDLNPKSSNFLKYIYLLSPCQEARMLTPSALLHKLFYKIQSTSAMGASPPCALYDNFCNSALLILKPRIYSFPTKPPLPNDF